jgi:hypothetical protein
MKRVAYPLLWFFPHRIRSNSEYTASSRVQLCSLSNGVVFVTSWNRLWLFCCSSLTRRVVLPASDDICREEGLLYNGSSMTGGSWWKSPGNKTDNPSNDNTLYLPLHSASDILANFPHPAIDTLSRIKESVLVYELSTSVR